MREFPDVLEYTGEFGPELVLFLPVCAWLSKAGLAQDRTVSTYAGMCTFYEDLGFAEIIEKETARKYVPSEHRPAWLPIRDEHTFDGLGRPAFHYYPDLRTKYAAYDWLDGLLPSDRALVVVHNKYNLEWGVGPVNHIPIEALRSIFSLLHEQFQVVYIRHGARKIGGFTEDHNSTIADFRDDDLLKEFPGVAWFDDLYSRHVERGGKPDLNCFKNVLYSRAHRFITSQGGGAHQMALFSGAIMLVHHRGGAELRYAYRRGYYTFMARIPPVLGICRTEAILVESAALFLNSRVFNGRALTHPSDDVLLDKVSPERVCE